MWVGIKDGNVIAAAPTSPGLVSELRKLGEAGRGVVARYVLPATDEIIIGVD